jgi:transposase-like protein
MGAKQGGIAEGRWRRLIAEQEKSGRGVAEFAENRGLCAATLYWWRSRLRRRRRDEMAIVPVNVVAEGRAPAVRGDGCFELELLSGHRLRVPAGFDADELARLVAAVERAC